MSFLKMWRICFICPDRSPGATTFGNEKAKNSGVSSGVSWFWDSVRFRAPWCSSVARSLLILLEGASRGEGELGGVGEIERESWGRVAGIPLRAQRRPSPSPGDRAFTLGA